MVNAKIQSLLYFFMLVIGFNQYWPMMGMEEKKKNYIEKPSIWDRKEEDKIEDSQTELSIRSCSKFAWDTWILRQVELCKDRAALDINRVMTDLPVKVKIDSPTLLLLAVMFGIPETVTETLEKGAEITLPVLSAAAKSGNVRTLRLLLKTAKSEYFDHALRKAGLCGHLSCVEELLRHGARVNAPDSFGLTVLHHAVASCNSALVELLLSDYKAHVNAKGLGYNYTPLDLAYDLKKKKAIQEPEDASVDEIIAILIKYGGKSGNDDGQLVTRLSRKESRASKELDIICQWNAWISMMINAVDDINEVLASTLQPVQYQNPTLLLIAVQYADIDVITELLNRGANITPNVLSAAGERGCTQILRLLIENGANVQFYGHALRCAAAHGKQEIIRVLLKETQVHIDEQDAKGMTPLHFAVSSGDLAMVKFLLDNGAAVNALNELQLNALDLTEQANYTDKDAMVKLLKRHGAKNNNKRCLLM